MAKAAGRNAAVYVSPNGTGVAVPITGLSKWTLNRETDAIPVTSFGDANKTSTGGDLA